MSAVAAAVHLKELPWDCPPDFSSLWSLNLFAPQVKGQQMAVNGNLYKAGRDERGYDVYILGRGPNGPVMQRILQDAPKSLHIPNSDGIVAEEIYFKDSLLIKIGCFLCKFFPERKIGFKLIYMGVCRVYSKLVSIVRMTASRCEAGRRV